ncbi:MAG: glycosyltransferase [Psychroserpens sp.]|uniref:glycosyltransferase n=1 Tax=Psychroserpens sp. TaxID=2020870 RepID=UPI003C73DB65
MSNDKKICIVATSLGKGGAERSTALLSKVLGNLGYDIHLVSIIDLIDYEYSGTLLNLGKVRSKVPLLAKIKKFQVFKDYLKNHQFDFVIDNRSRPSLIREFIISRILFEPKRTIYCVRSYNFETYFVKPNIIAKFMYNDAYKMVSVSKHIEHKIKSVYHLKNTFTIHNPVEVIAIEESKGLLPNDYILFYGRLVDDVKNVSLLIESFRNSILPRKDIKLIVLGSGKDREALENRVKALNLEASIQFIPFLANPFHYVKSARFTVLTSHYEGFPRSILESLALGTPVISVDCKSGPREIITNEFNGLLVENYNPVALSNAMNRFIEDESLYNTCKSNATKSVAAFSMESIGKTWQELLTENQTS